MPDMLHSGMSGSLRQQGGMAQPVLPTRAPSLGQQSAGHRLLSCGGISVQLELTTPRWKHSPAFCRGLIRAALEQGEAPEHPPYTDNIIVLGKCLRREKNNPDPSKGWFCHKTKQDRGTCKREPVLGTEAERWMSSHPYACGQ